jgi:hypothetical protein
MNPIQVMIMTSAPERTRPLRKIALGEQPPKPEFADPESTNAGRRRIAGRLSIASFWDAIDPRPGAAGDASD